MFYLPTRLSVTIFSGAGNFCLANELRRLTYDVKSDVRFLIFRSDAPDALQRYGT